MRSRKESICRLLPGGKEEGCRKEAHTRRVRPTGDAQAVTTEISCRKDIAAWGSI